MKRAVRKRVIKGTVTSGTSLVDLIGPRRGGIDDRES